MVAVLAATIVACGGGSGTPPADAPRKLRFAVIPKALDIPVFDYAKKGAERAAKAAGERRGHLARTGNRRSAQAEGDSRVVHHPARGRHRDLLPERRFPHRDHQPRHGRGHSRRHVGRRRAQLEADRVLRRRRQGGRPHHGRGSGQAAQRQGDRRADDERRRHEPAAAPRRRHWKCSRSTRGSAIIETFDVKEDTVKAAELIATGTNRYPNLGAWISVGGWPVFTRNALMPVPKGHARHLVRHDPARAAAAQGRGRCRS